MKKLFICFTVNLIYSRIPFVSAVIKRQQALQLEKNIRFSSIECGEKASFAYES